MVPIIERLEFWRLMVSIVVANIFMRDFLTKMKDSLLKMRTKLVNGEMWILGEELNFGEFAIMSLTQYRR